MPRLLTQSIKIGKCLPKAIQMIRKRPLPHENKSPSSEHKEIKLLEEHLC